MRPFSPLYFIRENKAKCILLIFMLFLGYGAYLGGVYVTQPVDSYSLAFKYHEKFAEFYLKSYDSETANAIKNEVSEMENVQLLHLGEYQSFYWKCVMGFECGDNSYSFRSVEDFKDYCEYMGIECDFDDLSSGSLIMSEMFAENTKLKIGNTVDESISDSLSGEFTLKALTQEDGYVQYFITDEDAMSDYFMLIGKNGTTPKELYDIAYKLQDDYDIGVFDRYRKNVEEQFETFNMIYMFVVILLSVILAVTINAAFVGMYQRRNFEFAVYRAIGISKWRIIGKIIGELFFMDVIALTVGGGIFFFSLYLFNNLSLYPNGTYIRYFDPLALIGLLLGNFTVLVPVISTRCRQMLKADICEY